MGRTGARRSSLRLRLLALEPARFACCRVVVTLARSALPSGTHEYVCILRRVLVAVLAMCSLWGRVQKNGVRVAPASHQAAAHLLIFQFVDSAPLSKRTRDAVDRK